MDTNTSEILGTEFTVKMNGAHLGYLLTLLAAEQERLNTEAEDEGNLYAVLSAATNDIVGNAFLHAVYAANGAELLAFAMKTTPEKIAKLMESKSPEEVQQAAAEVKGGIQKVKRKDSKLH